MKQLSEDTGISVRTLTRMKKATREQNPKYMPSIRTLQEISKVTNLPIEEMMDSLP
ncbi:helix-turn-helix transcriptional regulator [Acidaminococcus fermentans]|uniref:helix-turn-helix domain-containing protein n=1 Tax=Acidaminococcus fermentans TaxID=905 RepID=UPI00242A4541|nr:helix-turn-helix transcriptional regulator [Acidaminococcus fermentans]